MRQNMICPKHSNHSAFGKSLKTNRRNRSLLYCFLKDLYHEKQYISSVAVQSYRDDCNVDLEKFYHHYKAEKLRAMSEYCPNSTRHICLFGKLF